MKTTREYRFNKFCEIVEKYSNYEILSSIDDYKNNYSELTVKCENNHIIKTNYENVRHNRVAKCLQCDRESRFYHFCEIMKGKNAKVISSVGEYKHTESKLKVECNNGHLHTTSYKTAIYMKPDTGLYCYECIRIESYNTTKDIVTKKNGILLEDESKFVNRVQKLKIKCDNNHIFYMSSKHLVSDHWCPMCAYDPSKYFEKLCKYVKERNAKIVCNTVYKTITTNFLIKCHNNHEFKINLMRIEQNQWCPTCNLRLHEAYCKFTLENLTGKKFATHRPDWLKIKKSKKGMEIDLYNEELNLAIEYNGKQHYEFVPHFHRNKEKFTSLVERDKLKKERIEEQNINYIVIPYTEKDNLHNFILQKLKELNIEIDENVHALQKSEIINLLTPNDATKTCSICCIEKSRDDFYSGSAKCKSCYNIQVICPYCNNKYGKRYIETHIKRVHKQEKLTL